MCMYPDNRFAKMGVEQQMDANSWQEAKAAYINACMLCCTKHCAALRCHLCPIREAMLENAKIFRKKLTAEDKEWIENEKEELL